MCFQDHPDYALAYSAASIVINNFVQAWNDPSEPSYVIFNENRVPQFEVGAVEVPCISCKTPAVTKKWKATTTFVELYGHRMINLKPSELIAFINREAPDPKAVDDKLIKTFLASTSHRDINYQTVEYNIFNGWSFEDNGASSVPVAFTVGQFTAYTLSPRQRKATILFLELHGAAILKVQQADVETFVIDQVS